ncbi:MAG: TlpA family protein disulfide reductase [Chloroflexi bacterium]|nr:TlpA family protein disulfide reductase [Chloroflexota bacterium]MBI3740602.1 TlpA family protein disulfide reductase [Chloroflexota bacterium]
MENKSFVVVIAGLLGALVICAILIVGGIFVAGALTAPVISAIAPAPNDNINPSAARPNAAKIGELAPEINLKTVPDAQPFVLSKQEGKIVLVNFWATWCGPCREEFPAIVRTNTKFKDKGVVIVGVNTQDENTDAGVQAFMKNTLVNFTIVRDIGDRISRAYNVRGLPTTIFIDRKGVIRDIVIGGPMTDDYLSEKLNSLLQ